MRYHLPLPPISTLDELVERAQRGRAASHALEYLRDRISSIRDDLYRKLLNAPPDKLVELRADLKAIEKVAQALLVDEAQGELAYRQLYEISPPEQEETPLRVEAVSQRRRRNRRKDQAQPVRHPAPGSGDSVREEV